MAPILFSARQTYSVDPWSTWPTWRMLDELRSFAGSFADVQVYEQAGLQTA